MKKLGIAIVVLATLAACTTTDKKAVKKTPEEMSADSLREAKKQEAMLDTANYTTIAWPDSTFKMITEKVKEGKIVDVSFRFKNTGTHPLVINNVTAQCGCTIPEKPEEPIAPGAEGVIKATFNSDHKKGDNRKMITVDANTKPSRMHELVFEVVVE